MFAIERVFTAWLVVAFALFLIVVVTGLWLNRGSIDDAFVFDFEHESGGNMAWEPHIDTPKADQNRKAITELARSPEIRHEGTASLRIGLDFDQSVDEIEISRDLTIPLPPRLPPFLRWFSRDAESEDDRKNQHPPIDMSNKLITGYFVCRDDFPIGGQNPLSARLFIKDSDADRRKFYGCNVTIDRSWVQLSLNTRTEPCNKALDTDAGFSSSMIRTIGIQIAQNSVRRVSYRGFCYVDDVGWSTK